MNPRSTPDQQHTPTQETRMTTKNTPETTALPSVAEIRETIEQRIQYRVANARKLRMQIVGWRAEIGQATPLSIAEDARAAIETGDRLPEDLPVKLREDARATLEAEAMQTALGNALATLPTDAELKRVTVDETCTYLDGVMQTLATYARGINPQTIATSADAAIDAGGETLKQYRETRELVNMFGEIRRRQLEAYQQTGESFTGEMAARSGHYRDALDRERHWLDRRHDLAKRPSQLKNREMEQWIRETPQPRWDAMQHGAWPRNVQTFAEQVEFVIWALTVADPWVPTPDQLAEAEDRNAAAFESGKPGRVRTDLPPAQIVPGTPSGQAMAVGVFR